MNKNARLCRFAMQRTIITAILRRIKIWWKTPCYYSIVNGMQPIYESKEELMELLEEIKKKNYRS